MTTAAPTPHRVTPHRVTPARVLRSEWHKLWTLRTTWITLLAASALVLAVGITMGSTYDGDDSEIDTVVLTLFGTQLSQICLAVLGILITAGEYSTGMIRASLTAVPRRLPVLWSKAAVFTAVAFTLSFVTNVVTFLTAQIWLADTDKELTLTDSGVLGALAGNATGITLMSLIALGLGALLRSVPGGIGAFVGAVLVLPEIITTLPFDAVDDVVRCFPAQAASSLGSITRVENTIAPGPALFTLALWALAVLTAASLLLKRRDV
ncbi:ABC transporter permease [Streptomyces spectabilis]|uniref:ABC transporter permease n=1 Tax=Streptomyces spectabilis TaxID=68270 RepID=A0A5P2XCQ0_STRST|nr:ABC transporter permease [Streptomyces spectabilis]MBB5106514.1 ABC-type transport system involved in multi-copper enzyme maturation permease subunit [Streptomyces spectabilis]MCI3903623.1 ABC transporter permease [Streptomyces spectabilis]QEV60810.1 ABC transporter permease [Streptomyces spectabilis]GGV47827.1 ABC transporter permease [Streptomyces spectabilis]